MKRQPDCRFDIAPANTIVSLAPAEQPAVVITSRQAIGPRVTVCAVGDIGLSGRARLTAARRGPEVVFSDVAPILRAADISFGNLESPIAEQLVGADTFSAPATSAEALRDAGFDILHLANNHIAEYGHAGVRVTVDALRNVGVVPLGAGHTATEATRLICSEVNGLRLGWLGCGHTLKSQDEGGAQYWEFDERALIDAIGEARPKVDVLIVSIHIGLMYMDYPRPQHKVIAERLMACGADLILMHHAHVLQGIQVSSAGRVCCYNLGNFVYDWKEGSVQTPIMLREQHEGALFWFELDKRGVALAAALPTWIDEDCRVHLATADRGRGIVNRLVRISQDLTGDFSAAFDSQRAERNAGLILKVALYHVTHGNVREVLQSLSRVRYEHVGMLWRWLRGSVARHLGLHRTRSAATRHVPATGSGAIAPPD